MKKLALCIILFSLLIPGALSALPTIKDYCQEILFEDQSCDYYVDNEFFFSPSFNYGSKSVCENYQKCYNDPAVISIINDMLEIAKLDRKYTDCTAACGTNEDPFGCLGTCDTYYQQAESLRSRTIEGGDPGYWGMGTRSLCVYGLVAAECCPESSGILAGCSTSAPPASPPAAATQAEICDNGVDDDGDSLIDCADTDCASDASCTFKVTGSVVTGGNKPLAKAKIILRESGTNSEIVAGYTDNSGFFTLDYTAEAADLGLPDSPVDAYLEIYLEDEDGQFKILWDFGRANSSYSITTQDFELPTSQRLDIVLKRGNAMLDPDTKVNDAGWDPHWDASNTYYEAKRFFDFVRSNFGYGFNGGGNSLPVSIFVYTSESDTSAFYSPVTRGGGVFLPPWKASHSNPMCPENCLWHELFHFTMYNKYGSWATENSPYANHAGFKNNNTGDSYEEAFAEFWPNILAVELNGDTAHIYADVWNMELNYNPWVKEGKYEEFAMSTLLWDMWDSEEDKGDKMSVSYKPLWGVLMGQRLQSFKEVYDALKAKWPEKSSEIDNLFIAHGIFKDTYVGNGQYDEGEPYWDKDPDGRGPLKPNGKRDPDEDYVDIGTPDDEFGRPHQVYTPGEEIGTATNYNRTTRKDKPLEEGSFVRADVTSNGAAVSDAILKVSYSFSDPSLNYASYGVTDPDTGYVYVEIPPDEYQITASITADNYEGGQPVTVTANEFYASKASGAAYIKSGTITAGARKSDYCNSDGTCQNGESQNCGDCYLPPPGANSAPAGGDSTLLVAIVVIALVAVAAFVLLKGRKPAAKAVGKAAVTSGFCPMCGTAIPKDSAFCPNCGARAG